MSLMCLLKLLLAALAMPVARPLSVGVGISDGQFTQVCVVQYVWYSMCGTVRVVWYSTCATVCVVW